MQTNHQLVFDKDVHSILSELPYNDITWHESSPWSDIKYERPDFVNAILSSAQAIIAERYLPKDKQVEWAYARPWKGKTKDGVNRNYHSDKVWEQKNGKEDLGHRPVSNMIALYYHVDFEGVGGLKFWNRTNDYKEIVIPKFGEIIIIDERTDDVYHKVLECKPGTERYVVGFGFNVN